MVYVYIQYNACWALQPHNSTYCISNVCKVFWSIKCTHLSAYSNLNLQYSVSIVWMNVAAFTVKLTYMCVWERGEYLNSQDKNCLFKMYPVKVSPNSMKLCCLHEYRMTNSLRVVKKKESYLWKNEWNFTFVLLHMENTVKIYCTCIQTHLESTRDLVHFKRLEFTSKPVCVVGVGVLSKLWGLNVPTTIAKAEISYMWGAANGHKEENG